MSKVLGKSRRLVTLFHTSTSVNDALMVKQKLLLPDQLRGHKLIADVPTRWNSSLMMLARILEQLPALMAVATDENVSKSAKTTIQNCLLSFEKSTLAKSVVEVLKPFKNGTGAVCSETNPTINKILPVVTKLKRGLEEKGDDPPAIKGLKRTMRDQISKRTEAEDIALLGSILNPFTKGFEHMPSMKVRAEELLHSAVSEIHVRVHVKQEEGEENRQASEETAPVLPVAPPDMIVPCSEDQPQPGNQTQGPDEQPLKKKTKSADTDDWLSDVMCVGESRVANSDLVNDEIHRYLGVILKDNDVGVTVLDRWKKNELFFPRLASLAKRVLCVQGSSVPSERVFSLTGQLVSKKRSRLSPDNVDMFIFLNKNMGRFW